MRNSRVVVATLLILLSLSVVAQQPPAALVQIAYVEKTEVVPTVAVSGTIYSRNESQITASLSGRLSMVAEPGTLVAAGQSIAQIDTGPLLLQRAEQEVLLERAEINVRQLNSQLRRQRELQGSSLVSEFELEQTEANRDLAVSDARLTAVRIRQIDDQIRRASIRAPFSGVVISREHRGGEDVARGDVLAAITDIRNLEVRAFVPLKHLSRTVVGDSLQVFATDTEFVGTIRALVPTGDIRSQTFEALIDLPLDVSEDWTVGQLVSVSIPIRSAGKTLASPRDALVLRQDGAFVFRIRDDNKAERIQVSLGDSSGELIGVDGPLGKGDRVAVRGAENLRDGDKVKVMLSQAKQGVGSQEG
mgnify:CR=1 FL=1